MSPTIEHESIGIPSLSKQLMKQKLVYDSLHRVTHIYQALTDAADGAQCIVTVYAFDGVSQRITGSQEFNTTWDSAWDLSLT